MKEGRAKVKIYTTSTCPYCVMAIDFLKGHGVKFEEKNVTVDRAAANEMTKKSRQTGVPVLDIGGEIIIGFDREAIKRALKLKE
jgi:glutaredoxin-like YruB-family protein